MEEEWRVVLEYPDYEVSNLGRIRSLRFLRVLKTGVAGRSKGYRCNRLTNSHGKKLILIHRIMWVAFNGEIPTDMQIDHIDRDSSNCSLSNLRLATRAQNMANVIHPSNKRFRGVHVLNNKITARIMSNRKIFDLGVFATLEDAALAYNEAAIKYHGEFAILNAVENDLDSYETPELLK